MRRRNSFHGVSQPCTDCRERVWMLSDRITREDIAVVVSRWAGIPVVQLSRKEAEQLMDLEGNCMSALLAKTQPWSRSRTPFCVRAPAWPRASVVQAFSSLPRRARGCSCLHAFHARARKSPHRLAALDPLLPPAHNMQLPCTCNYVKAHACRRGLDRPGQGPCLCPV